MASWMYREDCPKGRQFAEDELEGAKAAGWRDAPPAADETEDSLLDQVLDELKSTQADLAAAHAEIEELKKPATKPRAQVEGSRVKAKGKK